MFTENFNNSLCLFGLNKMDTTCFPVQRGTGNRIAGMGRSTCSSQRVAIAKMLQTVFLSKKFVLLESKKAVVRKSWITAMLAWPSLMFSMFFLPLEDSWLYFEFMIWRTSALAVWVWTTCRFISSPSKSAPKGVQTHSLKRKVRWLEIFTKKPMIDCLCREGCRLKRQ